MRRLLFSLLMLCAGAVSADQALDAAQEARFARLAAELRCLVCQNQSIADSHADLATDLRREIRTQIAAGRSDDEIMTYMVERYGDFVLYRPPFKTTTWLLWLAPGLLLLAGLWLLRHHLRSRQFVADPPQLSEAEHARAAALLDEKPPR